LLSLVSAIYAGEKITIENTLGSDNLSWNITENTSVISILPIVNITSSNITITIPGDMPPCSFAIVFYIKDTNTIVQAVQLSSGGKHSKSTIKFVNNTKYVEVPKIEYITNTTVEYVNQTVIQEKEVEVIKPSTFTWFLLGLAIILLLTLVVILIKFDLYDKNSNSLENTYIASKGGQE
jgi:hypothetical protein